MDTIRIGLLTVSDRANAGQYKDLGGPAMLAWLQQAVRNNIIVTKKIVADEQQSIELELHNMVNDECDLILTTGGTGPARRDVTVEAVTNVCEKLLPGFGELMRQKSLEIVPTAILSRQTAGISKKSLIISLPGKPSAINDCLQAVFPAVPYCIDLIEGNYIETNPDFISVFRPANAVKK